MDVAYSAPCFKRSPRLSYLKISLPLLRAGQSHMRIFVVLSEAKDLAERSDTGREYRVRGRREVLRYAQDDSRGNC
jgi:hypothetical protein